MKVKQETIDKLDKQIAGLTGDVIPAYEEAYQAHWGTLNKERTAKKEMDKAGREIMRRVRRVFRNIVGRENWTEMHFDPACGYVIAHGENPCKKRPYMRVSVLTHHGGLQIIQTIHIRSAADIVRVAGKIRAAIEAYQSAAEQEPRASSD